MRYLEVPFQVFCMDNLGDIPSLEVCDR
jgi:hypothetical protein